MRVDCDPFELERIVGVPPLRAR